MSLDFIPKGLKNAWDVDVNMDMYNSARIMLDLSTGAKFIEQGSAVVRMAGGYPSAGGWVIAGGASFLGGYAIGSGINLAFEQAGFCWGCGVYETYGTGQSIFPGSPAFGTWP